MTDDGRAISPGDDRFQQDTKNAREHKHNLKPTVGVTTQNEEIGPHEEALSNIRDAIAALEGVPVAGIHGEQQHSHLHDALSSLQAVEKELANQQSQADETIQNDHGKPTFLREDVVSDLIEAGREDYSMPQREIADRLDISTGMVTRLLREQEGGDGDE